MSILFHTLNATVCLWYMLYSTEPFDFSCSQDFCLYRFCSSVMTLRNVKIQKNIISDKAFALEKVEARDFFFLILV